MALETPKAPTKDAKQNQTHNLDRRTFRDRTRTRKDNQVGNYLEGRSPVTNVAKSGEVCVCAQPDEA
eukprot:360011-Amphidinium_carterae.1